MVTVLGGGYVASGIADPSRLPTPWLPTGLKLSSQEGAGEVQTPLHGPAADALAVGDRGGSATPRRGNWPSGLPTFSSCAAVNVWATRRPIVAKARPSYS